MGYKPLISGKKNKKSPLEIIEQIGLKMSKKAGAGGNTAKSADKPCGKPSGMNYPGPGPKAGKPFGKK